MKYTTKPRTVTAVQWFKMGDHPAVVWFRRWGGFNIVQTSMLRSGGAVHSGDYIITHEEGNVSVEKEADFG